MTYRQKTTWRLELRCAEWQDVCNVMFPFPVTLGYVSKFLKGRGFKIVSSRPTAKPNPGRLIKVEACHGA